MGGWLAGAYRFSPAEWTRGKQRQPGDFLVFDIRDFELLLARMTREDNVPSFFAGSHRAGLA